MMTKPLTALCFWDQDRRLGGLGSYRRASYMLGGVYGDVCRSCKLSNRLQR